MKEISFEVESNEELFELLDKTVDNIFIHKFNPNPVSEWWQTEIRAKNGLKLNNILVRNMIFDLKTDLKGIEEILKLNINQLRIYQFEKSIPDTLIIENLPEKSREQILKNNGLKHFFWIDYEFVTICSFSEEFIIAIESNPKINERIKKRKTGYNNI